MKKQRIVQKKLTAALLTALIITGMGSTANLRSRMKSGTVMAASDTSVQFSETRKLNEIYKGTSKAEAGVRNAVSYILEENTSDLDYSPVFDTYSAFYTMNQDINIVIIYNSANVDMKAVFMTENGKKWIESYENYMKALSKLTGMPKEYITVVFNTDIETENFGNGFGPWWTVAEAGTYDAVFAILNNHFTWAVLHETSHCFRDCINQEGKYVSEPQYSMFRSGEEVFCNLRLLSAFHLLNWDTNQNILADYQGGWSRTDSSLDEKYRKKIQINQKDEKYADYFPEGSMYQTEEYTKLAPYTLASVHQFTASSICSDGSYPDLHFSRLANIFNTVTEKPIMFSYSHDPNDCNNWLNTDAVEKNWNTISKEEWLKLYALCIGSTKEETMKAVSDEARVLHQDYIAQCTKRIRYSMKGKEYLIQVTPTVQQWLNAYCPKDGSCFNVSGSLIQAFNIFDFMGADIGEFTVFYLDEENQATEETAAVFYPKLMPLVDYVARFLATKTTPFITRQPQCENACLGEKAKFSIKTSGDDLSYQWQFYDGSKWKKSTATGNQTANLTVNVNPDWDGREYRCVVTDSNGNSEISESAKLLILIKITKQSEKSVKVERGRTAVFEVEATGHGSLTYQWEYFDGIDDVWIKCTEDGADTPKLSVKAVPDISGTPYRCHITCSNGAEADTDYAVLVVQPIRGDVVTDDVLNLADVVELQKWLYGEDTKIERENADMNDDKKVNAVDLTLLKRRILEGD